MSESPELPRPDNNITVVRHLPVRRIAGWLSAAWNDLWSNPLPSIAYGLLFAIGGDVILLASLRDPRFFSFAVSGFFLIAPLLATGLYELSRQHAAGAKPAFLDSLSVFHRKGRLIGLFGLLLALISVAWERISAWTFAWFGDTFQHTGSLNALEFALKITTSEDHSNLLLIWVITGATVALFAFALSVVSLPMLLDGEFRITEAIRTSVKAFLANPITLLCWAATIVALTLAGFATLLFGLVIIMPLLGHASWHAYRELVTTRRQATDRINR